MARVTQPRNLHSQTVNNIDRYIYIYMSFFEPKPMEPRDTIGDRAAKDT